MSETDSEIRITASLPATASRRNGGKKRSDAYVVSDDSVSASPASQRPRLSPEPVVTTDDESEGSDGSEIPGSAAEMSPPDLSGTDDDPDEASSQTQSTPLRLEQVVGHVMAEILRSNSRQSRASDAESAVSSKAPSKASTNYWENASDSAESSDPSVVRRLRRKKKEKYEKYVRNKGKLPEKRELPKQPEQELGKYAARARRFDKSY